MPSGDPLLMGLIGREAVLEGTVLEPLAGGSRNYKVPIDLLRTGEGQPVSGRILLTLPFFPPWERGDRIRFETRLKKPTRYKNPGSFDYRKFLGRRKILLTGYVSDPEKTELLGRDPSVLQSLDRLRLKISRVLDENISSSEHGEAGFLSALLVGDRAGIPEKTWENFRNTGTAHLVAISGQHIGLLGLVLYPLFLWMLKRSERLMLLGSVRKLAGLLTLPPLFFYTLLAGASPSVLRAFALAVLIVLAVWVKRDLDPLSALAFGALLLCLIEPATLFSASFQLSFLAVLGILLFHPPRISAKRRFLEKYVLRPFWMTLGATLLTAPLIASLFHKISLSGLVTNLWAIPFVGLLLIFTSGSLVLYALFPLAGPLFLKICGSMTQVFLRLVDLSSQHSWVVSFYPTEGEVILAYLMLGLLIALLHWPCRWRLWAGTAVPLLLLWLLPAQNPWAKDLEVTFLDVGQGDAALVLTPGGESLLVDAGGFLIPGRERSGFEVGRDVLVPYLKRRGLKRIDRVLLSHPHPDHYGGLHSVFESFPVGEFWRNGQAFPDPSFGDLLSLAREKGVPERILHRGDIFHWAGLQVEVLYPDDIQPSRNINDNSLVVRLSWGEARILFPGDIEKAGEAFLSSLPDLSATILKIPHHGSRTSSSVPFIDAVRPWYAVASLGEGNYFGFPHPDILEKYTRRGVQVYRTDRHGAVTFILPPGFPRQEVSIRTVSSGE